MIPCRGVKAISAESRRSIHALSRSGVMRSAASGVARTPTGLSSPKLCQTIGVVDKTATRLAAMDDREMDQSRFMSAHGVARIGCSSSSFALLWLMPLLPRKRAKSDPEERMSPRVAE